MIDWFMLVLYILGVLLLISGVAVILQYFRFWEQKKRLPEACKYLDLKQRNDNLIYDNKILEKENAEMSAVCEEATAQKHWLEKNKEIILSLETDRQKQEKIKAEYESVKNKADNK